MMAIRSKKITYGHFKQFIFQYKPLCNGKIKFKFVSHPQPIYSAVTIRQNLFFVIAENLQFPS